MQEIATHSAGELRYFDLGELFYVVSLPTYFQSILAESIPSHFILSVQ